jgi:2-haloacid dehalogenase
MRTLPPHPDVVPGLEALAAAGLTMVALTNSPQATADAQIVNAGLSPFFTAVLSVEPTGRFKPARAVYEYAAEALGAGPEAFRMVAAHDWDIAGAMRAGYAGALITRPGVAVNPLYPAPDIVAPDLVAAAEAIIAAER